MYSYLTVEEIEAIVAQIKGLPQLKNTSYFTSFLIACGLSEVMVQLSLEKNLDVKFVLYEMNTRAANGGCTGSISVLLDNLAVANPQADLSEVIQIAAQQNAEL